MFESFIWQYEASFWFFCILFLQYQFPFYFKDWKTQVLAQSHFILQYGMSWIIKTKYEINANVKQSHLIYSKKWQKKKKRNFLKFFYSIFILWLLLVLLHHLKILGTMLDIYLENLIDPLIKYKFDLKNFSTLFIMLTASLLEDKIYKN